jgi:DNA (cytosine-5)-methyltransferase 1
VRIHGGHACRVLSLCATGVETLLALRRLARPVPSVLDLFAGAGGFTVGFRQAGFDVQRAVENHRPKVESYRANHPDVALEPRDIQDVVIRDPFDVVVGGPPCEPFTPANAQRRPRPLDRLHQDRIGRLVLQFIRIVGDVRPRVFLMENVVQVAEGPLRGELERFFADWGFPRIHFNEVRAEDAGAPSHRLRLFVSNIPIAFPQRQDPPPVAKVLHGLPPPGDGDLPNHGPHPLSPEKVARLKGLRPGEALYRYRGAEGKPHTNWLRLDADGPCPTVMGQSRFVHPTEPRLLTVREHARLMGYPDEYVFHGGRDQQYDGVGESVPPPVARALADRVRPHAAPA